MTKKLYRKLYKKCVTCGGKYEYVDKYDDPTIKAHKIKCTCDHGYVPVFEEVEKESTTNGVAKFERVGYHECIEVLLYRLHDMAAARNFVEREWLAETHSIVHLLWNRIGKKKYKL